MTKKAKREVDYSVGMPKSHCGKIKLEDRHYCRFFLPAPSTETGGCEKVAGSISRNMWCKLFERTETAK